MFPTLAFHEGRQRALFLLRLLLVIIRLSVLCIHGTPSRINDGTTGYLELHTVHISQHRGLCKLTVGIEHRDETAGYQVVHLTLYIRQVLGHDSRGDNGVVVGHFRRVKYLL